MQNRWCHVSAIILLASLLSGCVGQGAIGLPGQRYINVHIVRDGALVLKTEYGVSDSLSPAAIWRGLQSDNFDAVGTITAETDDPQTAVLKGKIRMVILHVNTPIAEARLDELRLIRASASGTQWQLAPGEVERTGKAAGL